LEDYLNSKDCCVNGNSIPVIERLIMDYESSISRIIIHCMAEIPLDLGIKRFMLVLRGKNSPFILKYKLDRLKTYSMLSNFTEERLRIIIESLIDIGYIESVYLSEYEGSNLKLTEKGREFLNSDNLEMGFMKKII
jgi:superfamily II DNA helicase RecQ